MPSFFSNITYALFAISLSIGIYKNKDTYKEYLKLSALEKNLSERVNNLKQQNNYYQQEINKIKDSPSYAKKILKDKYREVEKNETILFFED